MASIHPDPRRRQAELTAREERAVRRELVLSAREAELRGGCVWRRAWWAARLAPWTLIELAAAAWLVVAAACGIALVDSAVGVGAVVGLITLARMVCVPPVTHEKRSRRDPSAP